MSAPAPVEFATLVITTITAPRKRTEVASITRLIGAPEYGSVESQVLHGEREPPNNPYFMHNDKSLTVDWGFKVELVVGEQKILLQQYTTLDAFSSAVRLVPSPYSSSSSTWTLKHDLFSLSGTATNSRRKPYTTSYELEKVNMKRAMLRLPALAKPLLPVVRASLKRQREQREEQEERVVRFKASEEETARELAALEAAAANAQ